jgi:predicted nuclease of predicted toxin-antitoxin system
VPSLSFKESAIFAHDNPCALGTATLERSTNTFGRPRRFPLARTSKKRSGANWLSRLPKPPVFFLDRSLGKFKVAAVLRNAGATVEVHDDHFPQDPPDEEWLRVAGENGCVVLTKDKNIRFHTREKEALTAYDVRAFVLSAKALIADEMGQVFVRALPKIA